MLSSEASPPNLSSRVVSGGLWLGALAGTGRLIGLARLAILAHLLGPREFGMVGVALVTISMLEALSELGLFLALIQRKETSRGLLDTAWTLGLIRGAGVAALLFAAAPWISGVFASSDAADVVRAMALVPLIGGLANVGIVEFRRELVFRPYYLIQAGAILADLLVAVPLALMLKSAWAIVAGWWALTVTRVALSYSLHPYRPSLRLERQHLAGLLGYGRWIAGSSALQWAIGDGVAAVVGKLFGLEGLGLFQMAWRITGQPAVEAATLVSASTVSAYAKLRESVERAAAAYLRVLRVTSAVAVPATLGLALYAQDVLSLVLGPRWEPCTSLVRVLAPFALASAMTVVTLPVFQGIGRPSDQALVGVAEGVTLAVALPLCAWGLGLEGAAVATLARGVAGACASLYLARRSLRLRWGMLISAVGWPAVASLPLVPLRWGAFPGPLAFGDLALCLSVSAVSYVSGLWALDRFKLYRVDSGLLELLPRALFETPDSHTGRRAASANVTERP